MIFIIVGILTAVYVETFSSYVNVNRTSYETNMKIAYANVRSLNTSFSLVETVCNKQQIRVLGLSEIWHPDNSIKDNVKKKHGIG